MSTVQEPQATERRGGDDCPVTRGHVDFYRRNGYVQVDGILSADEVARMRALTDELNALIERDLPPFEQRNAYQQVFLQVVNVWRRDERFREFTLHPRLAEAARRLLGCARCRLWHDHLMTKMPGRDAKPTDWHQDFPYWPMSQPGPLSIWIPMQDVDWVNGCMHFVPGSHAWDLHKVIHLDAKPGEKEDIFDSIRGRSSLEVQRVYVPLRAGCVTFHNGLTLHAAGRNDSDRPRRVLSMIYMPDGETYDGKPHCVSDGVGLTPGQPFDGDLFPVVAEGEPW